MPNNEPHSAVTKAKDYYDSPDADEFYFRVWGGEDIHIGMYESPDQSISDASRSTVAYLANKLARFPAGTQTLDIGAGYGGSARYLAREKGYRVVCLNLSIAQNERNREITAQQNLETLIDVVDGDFENLPFDDASFDLIWSQDSILHSGRRKHVFEEVDRVLRPGGEFLFTDPMQTADADPEVIAPILERISLESLGYPEAYCQYAKELGWQELEVDLMPQHLAAHYSAVLKTLESREKELTQWVSLDYLERMKNGLRLWIEGGNQKSLTWGAFKFLKPA